ncbi:hypothetical protein CPLU01_01405 [Colletotrichum plurivorum]|uniref:Uncharacterized protein n=1 Tax=Colletotrichum plurivorum TaxID=2175906 RepID=A0A8H6U4S1_9PEZI|nr:hypothetical protein CPLU01_01405 [Colletotrichum plurivorum]
MHPAVLPHRSPPASLENRNDAGRVVTRVAAGWASCSRLQRNDEDPCRRRRRRDAQVCGVRCDAVLRWFSVRLRCDAVRRDRPTGGEESEAPEDVALTGDGKSAEERRR